MAYRVDLKTLGSSVFQAMGSFGKYDDAIKFAVEIGSRGQTRIVHEAKMSKADRRRGYRWNRED